MLNAAETSTTLHLQHQPPQGPITDRSASTVFSQTDTEDTQRVHLDQVHLNSANKHLLHCAKPQKSPRSHSSKKLTWLWQQGVQYLQNCQKCRNCQSCHKEKASSSVRHLQKKSPRVAVVCCTDTCNHSVWDLHFIQPQQPVGHFDSGSAVTTALKHASYAAPVFVYL